MANPLLSAYGPGSTQTSPVRRLYAEVTPMTEVASCRCSASFLSGYLPAGDRTPGLGGGPWCPRACAAQQLTLYAALAAVCNTSHETQQPEQCRPASRGHDLGAEAAFCERRQVSILVQDLLAYDAVFVGPVAGIEGRELAHACCSACWPPQGKKDLRAGLLQVRSMPTALLYIYM